MKYIFTIITLLLLQTSFAQWTNTSNLFTDANHMQVVTAVGTQQYAMSINSYPDGGYIVFWEDERSASTNKKDIYAQKYDKDGNKLWGTNGKPVANGTNNEHFYSSQNSDYRNYSYACTDSAGGFYMCYIDDSIQTYDWQRICIQHLHSNGSKSFSKGYIVAQTVAGTADNFSFPQLIADGNDGCFISFIHNYGYTNEPNIYCYKDNNGVMKNFGGGFVVRYYTNVDNECPLQLHNIPLVIQDYMIYPNQQNGCNIVASVNGGTGNETYFTAFNSVVRVKKNITVKVDANTSITYKKDSVLVYYQPSWHTVTVTCPGGAVGTAYVVDGLGFGGTGISGYNTTYSKGIAIKTDGNIVANVIAATNRRYIANAVTNWYTQLGVVTSEVYDAVPYSFTVAPYHTNFFNDGKPGRDSIVGNIPDTIFYANSVYGFDFAEQTTGSKIYFAGRVVVDPFLSGVYLQTLQFSKKKPHQYQLTYSTNNHNGINIGKEVSTGFGGSNIFYNNPQIAVDTNGHALFYINEAGRATRVSPIINQTQLAWGAMGRRIGSGTSSSGYYNPDMPFTSYAPSKGTGFVTMVEQRNIPENSGENIYGRHIDRLFSTSYHPPYKLVKDLIGGINFAYPESMAGSTNQYSLIEILNYNNGVFGDASPIAEILDNQKLGSVDLGMFQNITGVRTYNNSAYLNRNYNIQTSDSISGSSIVNLRLFFSTDDFSALKAADATITNPASLVVIKQTSTSTSPPSTYAPVSGEVKLAVQSWGKVNGGYYIEVNARKFSGYNNYFVFPKNNPPVAAIANNQSQNAVIAANEKLFIEKIFPTIISENNSVFIQTGNAPVKNMLVEIFGADGKRYYNQQLNYQSQTIQIPVFVNGMYNVKISAGKFLFTGTLMKAK